MPQLVAMSEAGDIVVSERDGVYWLHLPASSGGASRIDKPEADRYISYADLVLVGESYATYRDLDDAVNARASHLEVPEIDMASWDEVDVRGLLSAVARLVADGDISKARETLKLVANLSVVRRDEELHREVIDLLAGAQPMLRPKFSLPEGSPIADRAKAAEERWTAIEGSVALAA